MQMPRAFCNCCILAVVKPGGLSLLSDTHSAKATLQLPFRSLLHARSQPQLLRLPFLRPTQPSLCLYE